MSPPNSLLNQILYRDISGVSNLYKAIHKQNPNVPQKICTKWYEKSGIVLHPHDIKRVFLIKNKQVEDTYLRYTHFRTLHYRYFTNDLLAKCKVITDPTCSLCAEVTDSNYHMLLDCIYRRTLWSEVEEWIKTISNNDYILTDRRKVLGDLENNATINIIILNTEKVLYLCKLDKRNTFYYKYSLMSRRYIIMIYTNSQSTTNKFISKENGLYCSISFNTITKNFALFFLLNMPFIVKIHCNQSIQSNHVYFVILSCPYNR